MNFFPVINRAWINRNKNRELLRQFLFRFSGQTDFRRAQLRMQAALRKVDRANRFRQKKINRHPRIWFPDDFLKVLLDGFRGQQGSVTELQFYDSQRRAFLFEKLKFSVCERITNHFMLERDLQAVRSDQFLDRPRRLVNGSSSLRQSSI